MSFDKLKKDIHLWKEELRSKTETRPQKEWKLSSLRHDLEQMKYTMESYKVSYHRQPYWSPKDGLRECTVHRNGNLWFFTLGGLRRHSLHH